MQKTIDCKNCMFYTDETGNCSLGLQLVDDCCDLYLRRQSQLATASDLSYEEFKEYLLENFLRGSIKQTEQELKTLLKGRANYFILYTPFDSTLGYIVVTLADGLAVFPFASVLPNEGYEQFNIGDMFFLKDRAQAAKMLKLCRQARSEIESIESLILGVFKELDNSAKLSKKMRRM